MAVESSLPACTGSERIARKYQNVSSSAVIAASLGAMKSSVLARSKGDDVGGPRVGRRRAGLYVVRRRAAR